MSIFSPNLIALLGEIYGSTTIAAARYNLIGMVRVKIDDLLPEGEGIEYALPSGASLKDTLDIYIDGLLNESAKHLLQTAPRDVLRPVAAVAPIATNTGDGSGFIEAPADFLRFFALMIGGWQKEVTKTIHPERDKAEYLLQKNIWTRGGKVKPVVAINQTPTKVILEYYSLDTGDTHSITYLRYIPFAEAELVQDNLQDALTWLCAGRIRQAVKDEAGANIAFQNVEMSYANIY